MPFYYSSYLGELSVAVPGEILAMYDAWKTQGRLPWKRLFQPTIALASNGFKIDEPLAKVIKSTTKDIFKEKGFRYVCFESLVRILYIKYSIFRKIVLIVNTEQVSSPQI
jgi:gamma-glutamyltranspeptidase